MTRRVEPALTTNDVSFTITRASIYEERRRAVELARAIRQAADERSAGRLSTRIDWLPDDAATDVKLALLTGPDKSDCYFRHDATGLWIARDRQRVVDRLEEAIVDPAEDIPMGSSPLDTLISLKTSQRFPHDRDANEPMPRRRGGSAEPAAVEPGRAAVEPGRAAVEPGRAALRAHYLQAIARTLPARTGKSLVDAAQRVLWWKASGESPMEGADFRAARDVVIDHFEDVDPYNVDTNLGSYGRFFVEARMIPKLKALLDARQPGPFALGRGLALALLAKLDPSSAAEYVAREACLEKPAMLSALRDLPLVSTPQADDCLAARVDTEMSASAGRAHWNRFASSRCRTSPASHPRGCWRTWQRSTRHRTVPCTIRRPSRRPSPTGRAGTAALPTVAGRGGRRPTQRSAVPAGAAIAPTDGLRAFMRDRIASAPTATTATWRAALRQIGDADDLRFLEERRDRPRAPK